MKIRMGVLVSLLILILISSTIAGHFLPPAGILSIPLVISITTGLIAFTDNGLNIFSKALVAYLCVGLNDIGIKLWAGGMHDSEGMGWINMLLLIGLCLSAVMLLIGNFSKARSGVWMKIGSVVFFVALVWMHMLVFDKLGLPANSR